MQAARGAMDAAVGQAKRQVVELGYIVVLQTARRVANYNPHLHVLMTDGGLNGEGEWQALGYVPYDLLHRQWQSHVLKMVEERLAGNVKVAAVMAEMRAKYPKGFVAHLKGDIVPRVSELARYIVKYGVSSPILASAVGLRERADWLYIHTAQHDSASQLLALQELDRQFKSEGIRITSTMLIADLRTTIRALFDAVVVVLMIMTVLLSIVGGLGLMGIMS